MNKSLRIIIGAVLAATTSYAISIDLGPSGPIIERTRTFTGLEGVQLNGQSLSLDLTFANNAFVRIYSISSTQTFNPMLLIRTNASTFPGLTTGNGYVTDTNGQRYSSQVGSSMGDDGTTAFGLFPFWHDTGAPISVTTPFDIQSIHYNITLPTTPNVQVVSTDLRFFGVEIPNREGGQFFTNIGVGPGIPDQIPPVPDGGSTLLLLSMSLIGIFSCGPLFRASRAALA